MTHPTEPRNPPDFRFDGFSVSVPENELRKEGAVVTMEPRLFRLLVFFLNNPGRLIRKEELIDAVWSGAAVTDNALARAVTLLRKALGDQAQNPRYLETVPTLGYRWVCQPETSVESPASSRPRWRARLLIAAGSLAAMAAAAMFLRRPSEPVGVPRAIQLTFSQGLDFNPAFSPNGTMLAYSSDRNGPLEIYVRPLAAGAREIQVTADAGENAGPSWSPDGQYLVYHSLARGGLWVVPALGGTPRRLTGRGSQPAWSPDGNWIAYRCQEPHSFAFPDNLSISSRLCLVPADGGGSRELTSSDWPAGSHAFPSWTPDGARVLFVSTSGERAVWSIEPGGSGLRRESPVADLLFSPVTSGPSLFVGGSVGASEAALFRVSGDRNELIPLPGLARLRDVAVAPGGKRFAVTASRRESLLWSIRLSPRTYLPVGVPKPLVVDTSDRNRLPVFSPDGKWIAYNSTRRGSSSEIWVMTADGAGQRRLTARSAPEYLPSWTPDSRAVVFSSVRDGSTVLSAVSIDSGAETEYLPGVTGSGWPVLSPDGSTLLFHRGAPGALSIWMAPLSGGEPVRVTPEGIVAGYGSYSRDGRWIAIEQWRGDSTQVAVMPAGGGAPVPLTDADGQHWLGSFAPDHDHVAFARQRAGRWSIAWVSRSTNEQRTLIESESAAGFLRSPAWSPAGGLIVYESFRSSGNVFLVDLP